MGAADTKQRQKSQRLCTPHRATFPTLHTNPSALLRDSQEGARGRASSCGEFSPERIGDRTTAPSGSFSQEHTAGCVTADPSGNKAAAFSGSRPTSSGDEHLGVASREVFLVTDSGVTPVRMESVSRWPSLGDNPADYCQHLIEGWVWKVKSRSLILSVAVTTNASGLPWIGRRLVAGKRFLTLDFKAREFFFRCYRCTQSRRASSSFVFDDITSIDVCKLPWAKAFGFAGIQIQTKKATALICVRTTDAFLTWLHAFRLASNNSLFLPVSACVLDVVERKKLQSSVFKSYTPAAKADKIPGCCQEPRRLFRLIVRSLFGWKGKKHSQAPPLDRAEDIKAQAENSDHDSRRQDSDDTAPNPIRGVDLSAIDPRDSTEVRSKSAGDEGEVVVKAASQPPAIERPASQKGLVVCKALQNRSCRGRKGSPRRRASAPELGTSVKASDVETFIYDGSVLSECEEKVRPYQRKRGVFRTRGVDTGSAAQPKACLQRRSGLGETRPERVKGNATSEKIGTVDRRLSEEDKRKNHDSQLAVLRHRLPYVKDEGDYSDVYLTPDDSDTFRTTGG